MKGLIIKLILGFLLFTSCNYTKSTSDNEFEEIIVETEKGKALMLSDLFSDIYYLKLESNNLNPVGTIDKVVFHKDRIYVLDSKTKKIAVFGKNGNFIIQTNNTGRGPGEYLNIADFIIDTLNNNIELWDNGNRKVIKTDQNGNFLSEKPFPLYVDKFCKLSGNAYVFFACNYLNRGFFKEVSFNAIILDSSNSLINSFLPIKELKYLKSAEDNLFVKYGNGVNVTVPFDNQIYHVTTNGCKTKYKITFSNYNLPDNILESYKKLDDDNMAAISNAYRKLTSEINANSYSTGIHNIFENNKILFFQYRLTKVGTYTVVFNKQTKQVHVGVPENNIDFGLFGEPLTLLNDTLITYIYPFDLKDRIKSVELNKAIDISNTKYIELKNLSDSLQESENPIIVKFLLKGNY